MAKNRAFTPPGRATSRQVRYLRQRVSLTGLGTSDFDESIQGIMDVHTTFARCVPLNKLAPCGIVDDFDGYGTIELSNRYFTLKKDAATQEQVPFSTDIDPFRFLAIAAGHQYVHTEENVVRYYACEMDKEGQVVYVQRTRDPKNAHK
jgi:hypothetical protein